MADEDREGLHSDESLSAALQKLGRSAPGSAPPELGAALARAFHRHHLRRRITRMGVLLAALVAVFGGSLWLRTGPEHATTAKQAPALVIDSTQPAAIVNAASKLLHNATAVSRKRTAAASTLKGNRRDPDSELFVALPSFALETSLEDLRVVRVNMPASSLRLLGAYVNDELIPSRVTADLLVGLDGTPYAFRLIS